MSGEDKELLLREDRRLLGRLLGEVIGEQVGEDVRGRIETVRQSAVRFRRGESDKSELERLLDALTIDDTLHVVRAFSYFSHLLNIAEDVHQNLVGAVLQRGEGPIVPAECLRRRALLLGGAFLGWAGAGLAAARHLRAIEPK